MNLVFVTRCERIARFLFNVGDRMTFLIFLKLEKIILKNKERRHTSLVFSKTLPPPPPKKISCISQILFHKLEHFKHCWSINVEHSIYDPTALSASKHFTTDVVIFFTYKNKAIEFIN